EARVTENALPTPITVRGFGFVRNSVIQIDGKDVPTTFTDSTTLSGAVPQQQMENARIALISVKNPDPVASAFHYDSPVPLSVYNPVPTVTSLDASTLLFDPTPRYLNDTPKFPAQIIIHGTNFVKTGLVYIYSTPCDSLAGGFSGNRVSSTVIIGGINIACKG